MVSLVVVVVVVVVVVEELLGWRNSTLQMRHSCLQMKTVVATLEVVRLIASGQRMLRAHEMVAVGLVDVMHKGII